MGLSSGSQLASYRIVEELGRGGMATVYKAFQPALSRYVAIKVLPDQLAGDPGFRERFQQEAVAVARLRHHAIPAVHDYGQADGNTYIVTELLGGGTLSDKLGTPLPVAETVKLLEPIADALDYAHSQGVVHRDVKPSNVLLTDRGAPVLSDFGLAKMMESSSRLTATGSVMGTPQYMSPEQCAGEEAGAPSDLYSLGVMAYEMLCGTVPYDAPTPMAVIMAHLQKPLPLPRSMNPALSEGVEAILLKALAKSPADRYESAQAFIAALESEEAPAAIAASAPAVTSSPPAETRAPAATELIRELAHIETQAARKLFGGRRAAILAGLAVAGLLIVGTAGFMVIHALLPVTGVTRGTLSTFACGQASSTNADSGDGGPATSAHCAGMGDLAFDSSGNLYIAECDSPVVRKVTPGGTISTVAGHGQSGSSGDEGPATAANLSCPYSVAFDGKGDMFIADSNNGRIRRVDSKGIITAYVGSSSSGSCPHHGGAGLSLSLPGVASLAEDRSGNLYASVPRCEIVVKITSDGEVSIVAGKSEQPGFSGDGGPATNAKLASGGRDDEGIAVDGSGNLYIADTQNQRIREVTTDGIIKTIAGNGQAGFVGEGGRALYSEFANPSGLAVDGAGNVYVADSGNDRVRRIDTQGHVTTVAGGAQQGGSGDGDGKSSVGPDAYIQNPASVALDGSGHVYIGERPSNANYRVRLVS